MADDENLVATGICASLEALSIEVVGPASDGNRALELCREAMPDLALLDIRMPVMDGIACAAAAWSELAIPAVIVSAYSSQDYVSGAQGAGVFGYLLKPVTTESLRAAIAIAWGRAVQTVTHEKRIEQLEQSLQARRAVEMAKWKIIEARRIKESEAHALLQRTARNERRRLADIAADVLASEAHLLLSTDAVP